MTLDRLVTTRSQVERHRIFTSITLEGRDRAKNATAGRGLREVDGSLHDLPMNYTSAGSFKAPEPDTATYS